VALGGTVQACPQDRCGDLLAFARHSARRFARKHSLPATTSAKVDASSIAAFAVADEPEPGRLAISRKAIRGVHLTLLRAGGSGKAGTGRDKVMVGSSAGTPIVITPMGDGLGLAITEGIEDALSVHMATGLGAWAAGCAGRIPSLADAVPDYTEIVTIVADADEVGLRNARVLAELLSRRGIPGDIATLEQRGIIA
jgi:hypothetical protein